MAKGILDTIDTNPTYVGVIPSTGKKFKYRGYSAGEEQALLVAKESKEIQTILANVKSMISKCTFGEVDPDNIAAFDIEYILLMMRAKSVGEVIDLTLLCNECGKENDTVLNVTDINPPKIIKDANIVALNENVTVMMKYPGFDVLESMTQENVDVFAIIAGLIKQVVQGDNVIETNELDPKEVIRFIKGMQSKVIKKMTAFIYDSPSVQHEIKLKCLHCENENTYDFKGIHNFFV